MSITAFKNRKEVCEDLGLMRRALRIVKLGHRQLKREHSNLWGPFGGRTYKEKGWAVLIAQASDGRIRRKASTPVVMHTSRLSQMQHAESCVFDMVLLGGAVDTACAVGAANLKFEDSMEVHFVRILDLAIPGVLPVQQHEILHLCPERATIRLSDPERKLGVRGLRQEMPFTTPWCEEATVRLQHSWTLLVAKEPRFNPILEKWGLA